MHQYDIEYPRLSSNECCPFKNMTASDRISNPDVMLTNPKTRGLEGSARRGSGDDPKRPVRRCRLILISSEVFLSEGVASC
jgi:hypothetical protein